MVNFSSGWSERAASPLSQRGRAGLDILGNLQVFAATRLRDSAQADFHADPEGSRLAAAHDDDRSAFAEILPKAHAVAARSPAYRMERLVQRYVAEEIWRRAIPAIEERRERFSEFADAPETPAGGRLELDGSVKAPAHFDDWDVHLEPGGFDGYDLRGAAFAHGIGPKIFKRGGYAAVDVGVDIYRTRLDIVRLLPKPHYARIYDAGCGGFSMLKAVSDIHPEAELVGADVSARQLRMGHLTAERAGIAVTFKQRDVRDTQEPDASFDAVVIHSLMHEQPVDISRAVLAEMFRILKPGGDIVVSDPPAFRAVPLFRAVLLDWETANREEPYFSEALAQDWAEEMKAIGFVDTENRALGSGAFPYVAVGRKPAA